MAGKLEMKLIGDKALVKYLQNLETSTKRKGLLNGASMDAAKPMVQTARRGFLRTRSGAWPRNYRRAKTSRGLIKAKRGKKKYEGSAWVLGGPLANIYENRKSGYVKAKKGKKLAFKNKQGETIFVDKVKAPRRNPFLSMAYRAKKGTTQRIWREGLRKRIEKHAARHGRRI